MNVLLLCDRASAPYQEPLSALLSGAGHHVECAVLSRESIKPCLGCFGCWLQTPGMCVQTRDDANKTAALVMRADAVILLSEIAFGGFSADIKAFLDRSIQNILPYFEIRQGEMHHAMRYDRFPVWIAVGCGGETEDERQTFCELAERNAVNMRPPKHWALAVEDASALPAASRAILQALEGQP